MCMNSQQRYKRRWKEKQRCDSPCWPLGGGIDPGRFSSGRKEPEVSKATARQFAGKDGSERDVLFVYVNKNFESKHSETLGKFINKLQKIYYKMIIKKITEGLIKKYYNQFFIYPAASKMHHAYVGGLAHHCIGMLHFAEDYRE